MFMLFMGRIGCFGNYNLLKKVVQYIWQFACFLFFWFICWVLSGEVDRFHKKFSVVLKFGLGYLGKPFMAISVFIVESFLHV